MNISKETFKELLKASANRGFKFSSEMLNEFKDILDWKEVSANETIDWNYHLVKEYELYLDWSILQQNKKVNSIMTLGLLFPHRVDLPECHCSLKYDFCECDNPNWHNGNWERGIGIKDEFNSSSVASKLDYVIQIIVYNLSDELLKDILLDNYIDKELLNINDITLN